ncbi:TetR/AcrR family transcriptional regulator [Pseudonocardia nigra]|uniref:TetR/AcrR family transcriptional regulator n=1 Tax=Pseudonocardia nigra TaxID=1921578 RepID=UPI001C5F206E|nr:TetR family transcriptional regulator [Pseudonocardia nigra]
MPVGGVRERRRGETVQEIKDAALQQLAESGSDALSLRAVARTVGMTVQSLYHYFDSRNALLVALVTDAHSALANAVEAAAERTRGRSPLERRLAATGAFRDWALVNRAAFLLLYGTPVPGFDPFAASGPDAASLRLAAPFVDVVFGGWTPQQLAAVPAPPGAPLQEASDPGIPLPPAALELFIELRARMHGLVMLELIGHLQPFNDCARAMFTAAMHRMSDDVDALQRALPE